MAAAQEDGGGPLAPLPNLKSMFEHAGVGYLAKALRDASYDADTVVMKMVGDTGLPTLLRRICRANQAIIHNPTPSSFALARELKPRAFHVPTPLSPHFPPA